jgi:DNA-binding CsgD family transcriptional regulator
MLSLSRGAQNLDDHELSANESKMRQLVQVTQVGMTRFLLPKLLPESLSHITPREKEVLRWTADGKTSYEIGKILAISINAVNFHVNNVVAKLDASNKTHAVAKAGLLGLLG